MAKLTVPKEQKLNGELTISQWHKQKWWFYFYINLMGIWISILHAYILGIKSSPNTNHWLILIGKKNRDTKARHDPFHIITEMQKKKMQKFQHPVEREISNYKLIELRKLTERYHGKTVKLKLPAREIGCDPNVGFDWMVGGEDEINTPWIWFWFGAEFHFWFCRRRRFG